MSDTQSHVLLLDVVMLVYEQKCGSLPLASKVPYSLGEKGYEEFLPSKFSYFYLNFRMRNIYSICTASKLLHKRIHDYCFVYNLKAVELLDCRKCLQQN